MALADGKRLSRDKQTQVRQRRERPHRRPRRIFTWPVCETRDDKGHAVLYDYQPGAGAGVDLIQAYEGNAGDGDGPRRTDDRYLKPIAGGMATNCMMTIPLEVRRFYSGSVSI